MRLSGQHSKERTLLFLERWGWRIWSVCQEIWTGKIPIQFLSGPGIIILLVNYHVG